MKSKTKMSKARQDVKVRNKTGLPFGELTLKFAALSVEAYRFSQAIVFIVKRAHKGNSRVNRVFFEGEHKKDVSFEVLRKIEEMTKVFSRIQAVVGDTEKSGRGNLNK